MRRYYGQDNSNLEFFSGLQTILCDGLYLYTKPTAKRMCKQLRVETKASIPVIQKNPFLTHPTPRASTKRISQIIFICTSAKKNLKTFISVEIYALRTKKIRKQFPQHQNRENLRKNEYFRKIFAIMQICAKTIFCETTYMKILLFIAKFSLFPKMKKYIFMETLDATLELARGGAVSLQGCTVHRDVPLKL